MTTLAASLTGWLHWRNWPRYALNLAVIVASLIAAAIGAYLVVAGLWFLPATMILLVAGFVLFHRHPTAAVTVWLVLTPFLVDDAGGVLRRVFWLVHRLMPLGVVILIIVARNLGLRERPLPRLGRAELVMAGYVVLTMFSIAYISQDDRAMFHLYDRVIVPMLLYLVLRLSKPDEDDVKRLLPVLIFVLLSQAAFGMLQWAAPGVLPSAWLDRAGTRTTGSLRSVGVYGTTMVLTGLVALHAGWHSTDRRLRLLLFGCAGVAAWMIFMTLSRASWIAGAVAVVGALLLYPGLMKRMVLLVIPLLIAVMLSGAVDNTLEIADRRFLSAGSEQSALGRLPIVFASLKMFEERPLVGFGYGDFDLYDRQYQGAVGGLVVPEKDHASHNLYLTVLAEQGAPGLLLYVGPALVWLARLPAALRRLPATGIWSRKLLIVLWLEIAAHVVVNNFANMRVPFGLGLWWLTLGMIAVMTERALQAPAPADGDIQPLEVTVGPSSG